MPPRLHPGPTLMPTEVEVIRHKIRGLYPKRKIGDLTEKVFQKELIERTLDLYRALLKGRLHKGESIIKEHHVVRSHLKLAQSVLREPEQEAVSLFTTDRRLFRIQSILLPNRPPTADEHDQTFIEELPLNKIRSLSVRRQVRWGEVGVGVVMGAFALLFASWLSFTGPFMIGLGAAGILARFVAAHPLDRDYSSGRRPLDRSDFDLCLKETKCSRSGSISPGQERVRMKGKRVLLVDDEVDFTSSLAKVLSRRGFEVKTAADGLEAMTHIANTPFDVIVLDVKMPGMDGIQVLTEIRRLALDTRVILLTGHLSVTDEENGLKGGAFAYLFKPFPILKLVSLIDSAASGDKAP